MRFLTNKILYTLAFLGLTLGAFAQQPANDECDNATPIADPRNVCINGSNVGATAGSLQTGCFTGNGGDVWYSFRAVGLEVAITIAGAGSASTGFTLRNANMAFSSGTCTSIDERTCRQINTNGTAEMVIGGLLIGETYRIRVWGAGNTTGTFQLCVKNYNPPVTIEADCPTAAVLCDKSPFSVARFVGAGADQTELNDAPCLGGGFGVNAEEKSVWFKWTCQDPGSLTFRIRPFFLGDSINSFGDDIDFAIYELPSLNVCTGKRLLRCMGSGAYTQLGCSGLNYVRRCQGDTGLRDGETDVTEPGGCSCTETHSNFVAPIQMEAGKSYAIGINNFRSSVGQGFSIEFGGTGTFVGPQAKIASNKPTKRVCLGEDIVFQDSSTFALGSITKRKWRFGKDASLDTSNNVRQTVYYKSPGWKTVVLTVTTDRGCEVTTILDSIYVEPFKYDSVVRQPTCALGTDGMLRVRVTNCGRAPIRYNWQNLGYSTTRDSIAGLSRGRYRLVVTDASDVFHDTLVFDLKELEVELDTSVRTVTPPTCFGSSDAVINLNPVTGQQPYQYNWNDGRGFISESSLRNLTEGQYTVVVRDANACRGTFTFDVIAPPRVVATIDTINISCFGKTDGVAVVYPSGGVGNYSISWSTGSTLDSIKNLTAGTYSVTITDGNNCTGVSGVRIAEPTPIGLTPLRVQGARCFGDSTAALVVLGQGGTPPYRYSIDGIQFQRDTAFRNIPAANYTVTVRDSTGCKATFSQNVPQPPRLFVSAGADVDIDLGFSTTLRAVVIPNTRQVSFRWQPQDSSLNCTTCPDVVANPVRTTKYTVTVRDSNNCTAVDEVVVNVAKKRPIYIPNVFSPNNDGANDWFTAFSNQAATEILQFKVFNRWGDLVFTTQNIPLNVEQKGWNGTWEGRELNPEVYTYYMLIKFIDGEEVLYKGDVSLMR